MQEHAEFWEELQKRTSQFLAALHTFVDLSTTSQINEEDFINHALKHASPSSDTSHRVYRESITYETDTLPRYLMKKYREIYKEEPYFLEYKFEKGVLSIVPKETGVGYDIPINQSILSAINYKIEQVLQVASLPTKVYQGKEEEILALEYRHYKRLHYAALFLWTVNVPFMQKVFKEREQSLIFKKTDALNNQRDIVNQMVYQAYQCIIKHYIFTPTKSYMQTERGMLNFIKENEKMMYALNIYTKELEQLTHILSTYRTEVITGAVERMNSIARHQVRVLS